MNATGLLVVLAVAMLASAWLVLSGWRQPRPDLVAALGRIHRPSRSGHGGATDHTENAWNRWWGGRPALARLGRPWAPALRLIGSSVDQHLGALAATSLIGLVVPSAIAVLLRSLGVVSLSATVPVAISLAGAVVAPMIVHADAMARADDVRIDVRYQLSAYLDMVIMLLAGNTGHEGALQQAGRAGDGLLFRQLRRRTREVGATGQSLVEALSLVADDYGLVELEQVAATTALSAAQGAPVARTLAAKCSTLRGTIAAEQEATARVRTDKVTPSLVGMALLFMALIIYPALNLN